MPNSAILSNLNFPLLVHRQRDFLCRYNKIFRFYQYGYNTAKALGDAKEQFDFYWNQAYKGIGENAAQTDRLHDLSVNANGRLLGDSGLYNNAQDACADYRSTNPAFPKKYW